MYFCTNDRYALCITPRYVEIFSGLYDDNSDDSLTPYQRAVMFTSMVVQPESLMLKVCNRIYPTELQASNMHCAYSYSESFSIIMYLCQCIRILVLVFVKMN